MAGPRANREPALSSNITIMKITKFDSVSLDSLRASLNEALATVAAKHGISLTTGMISFAPDQQRCTVKVEAGVFGEDGMAVTRAVQDFKLFATAYGLKPEHLGQTFVSRGKKFKLVGINGKASKRPFIIEDEAGVKYTTTEAMVLHGLGIKQTPLLQAFDANRGQS